ncbi:cell wall anchor protein [Nonlabens agnitus]|uniref:Cell wall anchor protein n=1 Tax=Nonlabens agnitus TaxID=870484 RepID=A0A2S9WX45_9FLAO|nr:cell wall anchor protein [Nonlabens agnitus]PRP68050.1 cell wall anchor protein [Nonlabens agnitus]
MKKSLFIFCFLCFVISFAQVGIGTAMPDPSALLDISSSTQGMLAPRMTTTQRLAIVSPANGLLVYDTDENRFFFYEDDSWSSLDPVKKRTNYKLVQSIADLTDELTAGSGSKYVLNTDFLYEINGTIIFDFPIDLNGAYIEGVDSSEDILVNNSSGSLFEGTSGGGLRNLTLSGNGKQLFDITGTATDLLLINNTVIAGASTVGTLSGLGTVFLSVTQYISNMDGLTIDNIDNFFVSNIFWTETNTGTFMEFTGSFEDLQMNGGRVVTDSGEIGIDVSANPNIVNDATLAELSFVGDGTFVEGYTVGSYTGFNFTNDWNVNCSGIPAETDVQATGDLNFDFGPTTGAPTTFTSNIPKKLEGFTTTNNSFRFIPSGNNRIVYDGKQERFFNVNASLSFQGDMPNDRFIFYLAKGGPAPGNPAAVLNETRVWRQVITGGDLGAVPITGVINLEPGEYVEVWVQRFSGSGRVLTVSLNLTIF